LITVTFHDSFVASDCLFLRYYHAVEFVDSSSRSPPRYVTTFEFHTTATHHVLPFSVRSFAFSLIRYVCVVAISRYVRLHSLLTLHVYRVATFTFYTTFTFTFVLPGYWLLLLHTPTPTPHTLPGLYHCRSVSLGPPYAFGALHHHTPVHTLAFPVHTQHHLGLHLGSHAFPTHVPHTAGSCSTVTTLPRLFTLRTRSRLPVAAATCHRCSHVYVWLGYGSHACRWFHSWISTHHTVCSTLCSTTPAHVSRSLRLRWVPTFTFIYGDLFALILR